MHHLRNYTALYFALLLAIGGGIFYFTAKDQKDHISSGTFAFLSILFFIIWINQRKKKY